jgi:hypothetical protein
MLFEPDHDLLKGLVPAEGLIGGLEILFRKLALFPVVAILPELLSTPPGDKAT